VAHLDAEHIAILGKFVREMLEVKESYFGSLYAATALSTGMTYALMPGGATWMSSFLRISSCATSSLTHMIRLQPVIFVQTVATCP